jgi:hypothetical protein
MVFRSDSKFRKVEQLQGAAQTPTQLLPDVSGLPCKYLCFASYFGVTEAKCQVARGP